MSQTVMSEYLYFHVGMYITTYFRTLILVLYWCLAYIRDGTIALRMYVTVVSPYPWDRDVTGAKRSNLPLDAIRVFTFHLNLAQNYKSITFSLCTFNLLLSFMVSSDLLCLRFSIVETPWNLFGWDHYNAWLQPLFIGFYNTTPI